MTVLPTEHKHETLGAVAAERLSALVRIPTVSSRDEREVDHAAFRRFADALRAVYPRVHSALERETVSGHGLLYRWRGASETRPVVLMAHQDVVPVVAEDWQGDPFSGEIRDGAVHGRGTLDDKGSLVAVLDAVETLLAEGFTPAQDVWLSFGADEEIGGTCAQVAVDGLRQHGITPWLVLDEGGAVATGAFPGVEAPVAVVGVAEKGIADIELVTTALGGHASTPARGGATARLARAVVRVDRHPFPASLPTPTVEMLATLAPHAVGPIGSVLRLLLRLGALRPSASRAPGRPDVVGRLTAPLRALLARLLGSWDPETSAMVRTTVAVTQLQGSPGANVVAASARARLNVRIAPGSSVDAVVARLRRVVRDPAVSVRAIASDDPSPVAPTDGEQFALLRAAVGEAYPEAVVTPYVMLGSSDARRFHAVWPHVYRFSPFAMTREQRWSIHGAGEHLTVDALGRGVVFYRTLLRILPS